MTTSSVRLKPWSLETCVSEALANEVALDKEQILAVQTSHGVYHILSNSLFNLDAMGLGELPLSVVALPEGLSQVIQSRFQDSVVRDVTHHLSDYFPNFFVAALYELESFFEQQQTEAYIIGGIVRDLFISNERRFDIEDVDITIQGQAIDVARQLAENSRNFVLHETYDQFGTANLDYKGRLNLDFASTRTEVYKACAALPEVTERGVPLLRDVIRRDFTINSLALSLRDLGKVIDCHAGLADIEAQQLRVLKPASFFEDPSRAYRLLKFWLRLGFEPSEDTLFLLRQFMDVVPRVYKGGGDRIKYELMSLLSLPESPLKQKVLSFFRQEALHLLMDTQLPKTLDLPCTLEILSYRMEVLTAKLSEKDEEAWDPQVIGLTYMLLILASFGENAAWHAADRLGLTRLERDALSQVLAILSENPVNTIISGTPQPSEVYQVFYPLTFQAALAGIVLSPSFESALDLFLKYKTDYEPVHIELDGDDLILAGIPQGEEIRHWMRALLNARLDGDVQTRLDELEWLKNKRAEQ